MPYSLRRDLMVPVRFTSLSIDSIMFINLDEFERRRMAENNLVLRLEIPDENPPSERNQAPTIDRKRFAKNGTQTEQPRYTTEEKILIGTTAQVLGPKAAAEDSRCE